MVPGGHLGSLGEQRQPSVHQRARIRERIHQYKVRVLVLKDWETREHGVDIKIMQHYCISGDSAVEVNAGAQFNSAAGLKDAVLV